MPSLRKLLLNVFLRADKMLANSTKQQRLSEFLAMVQPVTTNHELIRIGADADGGYLLPDDLAGITTCFSPGVAYESSFELDLARRGIRSCMADASVSNPPVQHHMFDFEKRFVGSQTRGDTMTLEDWMARKAPPTGDLLLQMDIEGSEFDVILASPQELLRRFRILVLEFHHMDLLLYEDAFRFIRLTFEKLLRDFEVVHIHPNNASRVLNYHGYRVPLLLEFTFLRRDRVTSRTPAHSFPHRLDRPNVAAKPDLPLPLCWYNGGDPER